METIGYQELTLILSLLGSIFGTTAFLWNKLDKIWRAIAALRANTVSHEVCTARRRSCRRCGSRPIGRY